MRLVYEDTGAQVCVGDYRRLKDGQAVDVVFFREPHKPESSGKVVVSTSEGHQREYFVGIIGAIWIEREDQGWVDPDYDPTPYCAWCMAMDVDGCDCGPIAENH